MARQTIGSSESAQETIHHASSSSTSSHDSSAVQPAVGTAPAKAKVCRMCGENVAGRRRYKDGSGQYYCEDCFNSRDDEDDLMTSVHAKSAATAAPSAPPPPRQHEVACPGCKKEFDPAALKEFKGERLCDDCIHHREQAAKREAARIHAAEEEARRQDQRRKTLIISAIIVVALLALYGAYQYVSG